MDDRRSFVDLRAAYCSAIAMLVMGGWDETRLSSRLELPWTEIASTVRTSTWPWVSPGHDTLARLDNLMTATFGYNYNLVSLGAYRAAKPDTDAALAREKIQSVPELNRCIRVSLAFALGNSGDRAGAVRELQELLSELQTDPNVNLRTVADVVAHLVAWTHVAGSPADYLAALEKAVVAEGAIAGKDHPIVLDLRVTLLEVQEIVNGITEQGLEEWEKMLDEVGASLGDDHELAFRVHAQRLHALIELGQVKRVRSLGPGLVSNAIRVLGPVHELSLNLRARMVHFRSAQDAQPPGLSELEELEVDLDQAGLSSIPAMIYVRRALVASAIASADPERIVAAYSSLDRSMQDAGFSNQLEGLTVRKELAAYRGLAGDSRRALADLEDLASEEMHLQVDSAARTDLRLSIRINMVVALTAEKRLDEALVVCGELLEFARSLGPLEIAEVLPHVVDCHWNARDPLSALRIVDTEAPGVCGSDVPDEPIAIVYAYWAMAFWRAGLAKNASVALHARRAHEGLAELDREDGLHLDLRLDLIMARADAGECSEAAADAQRLAKDCGRLKPHLSFLVHWCTLLQATLEWRASGAVPKGEFALQVAEASTALDLTGKTPAEFKVIAVLWQLSDQSITPGDAMALISSATGERGDLWLSWADAAHEFWVRGASSEFEAAARNAWNMLDTSLDPAGFESLARKGTILIGWAEFGIQPLDEMLAAFRRGVEQFRLDAGDAKSAFYLDQLQQILKSVGNATA